MAMQSRRDLYQAHRLMTTRAELALLRGEPDVPDQPLRRMNVGTFAGVLVGVIAAGIFGIWGLLFHGSPGLLNTGGSVIIDKQTGAPYVFCKINGQNLLCPAANYASALLTLTSEPPTIQTVNQSSLTGTPYGPEIGIVGLPDLPSAGMLFRRPWAACTQTVVVPGQASPQTTTVLAGGIQPGGQPLSSTGLLLVTTSDTGQDWVIGNGQRMRIDPTTMADVFPTTKAVSVPSVWLNALPQGDAFAAPLIAGQGKTTTGPDGKQVPVGRLYQTGAGAGTHYYVTLAGGGLASITQTQESLLALQPGALAQGAQSPTPLSPSQLGHVSGQLRNGLPDTDTNPVSASPSAALCVVLSGSGSSPTMQVKIGGQMPVGTKTGAPAGSGLVDQVALPPGKGALVKEAGSSISYLLVTDGHRYAMAGSSVPFLLGYNLSEAVQVPAGFLDMIPPGPGFDPAQAKQPVPVG